MMSSVRFRPPPPVFLCVIDFLRLSVGEFVFFSGTFFVFFCQKGLYSSSRDERNVLCSEMIDK